MDHRLIHTRALDFWLARVSVVVIVGLQLIRVNDLSLGPWWLAPALELAILIPLSLATAWTQYQARRAETEAHRLLVMRGRSLIRSTALLLTAVVTAMNMIALVFLVQALLAGEANNARTLLVDAVNIWATNVIVFALWFWSTDPNSVAVRGLKGASNADFLFPQMALTPSQPGPAFAPGFIDYLFVAFTNATAFSPTDTMPLTQRAKLLMMAQATVSLLTVALVAARAVNILA